MKKLLILSLVLTATPAFGQTDRRLIFPGEPDQRPVPTGDELGGIPWSTDPPRANSWSTQRRTAALAPATYRRVELPPLKPEALKRDIDELDARLRAGLAELEKSRYDLERDRSSWARLDRTVASAARVNDLLLARCEQMITIYEQNVSGAMRSFKEKLAVAPTAYRSMATGYRTRAASATIPPEREAYLQMAEMAETAAVLCERRYREAFTGPDGTEEDSKADTLTESMEGVRKMRAVHVSWKELLAAWPSVLNDPKLSNLFDHLSRYSNDLAAYSAGVTAMVEVMKRNAAVNPNPRPNPTTTTTARR